MDHAVALLQAYRHVNSYLTVTEYPVLETLRHGYRTATDLDILAFRFPGAGRLVPASRQAEQSEDSHAPDPMLGAAADQVDMLIGEVKEGRAQVNPAARDPEVLAAALARFGCCSAPEAVQVVRDLLRRGQATTPCGHRIRMIVFGSTTDPSVAPHWKLIPMGHVVEYLQSYLREHWDALGHTQFKDPALGFLLMLEKALRGGG